MTDLVHLALVYMGVAYLPLTAWAGEYKIPPGIARDWVEIDFLPGAKRLKSYRQAWYIPTNTPPPTRSSLSDLAVKIFSRAREDAYQRYQEDLRRATKIGDFIHPERTWWTKKGLMRLCLWPYPQEWAKFRKPLEQRVGLIWIRRGRRAGGVWTIAQSRSDRERVVVRATKSAKGAIHRARDLYQIALAPGDEPTPTALDEGSLDRINASLEDDGILLEDALELAGRMEQRLLNRQLLDSIPRLDDEEDHVDHS